MSETRRRDDRFQARGKRNPAPILVLSAETAVKTKAAILAAGADDHVVKPFVVEDVAARVHARQRRAG